MSSIATNNLKSLNPSLYPLDVEANGLNVTSADTVSIDSAAGVTINSAAGVAITAALAVTINGNDVEHSGNKNQPNGYAGLDVSGKIPVANLPSSVMTYKGVWNAATNTPTLIDGTGAVGDVYRVTADGTQDLGSGPIIFNIGDYVIYNDGLVWEKADTTDNFAALASENRITNGDFEVGSVTGWSVYANTAASTPDTGTGGSPNVTFSTTVSSPLSQTTSALLTKDAANRQGEGVSTAFSIEPKDKGRVIPVSFDYIIASGTFSAGTLSADSDVTVWIYDVTNSILIPLTDRKLYSNSSTIAGKFISNFQASADSTSYRLILHIGSTNASAYALKIDNVQVSSQELGALSIITDWQAFPSVAAGTLITGTSSNPAYGTVAQNVAYWRRVGDSMEILWSYRQTAAGSAGSGTYLFNLPLGYQIDTAKLAANTSVMQSVVGSYQSRRYGSGNVVYFGGVGVYSATQLFVTMGGFDNTNNTAANKVWGSVDDSFAADTDVQRSIHATVPIAGWGSAIQTAFTGDDGRVIIAQYSVPASTAFTAATQINFSTKVEDTHNAVTTGALWKFTAPISSWFEAAIENFATTSGTKYIELYKNGAQLSPRRIFMSASATDYSGGTTKVYLKAGEYIDIRSHADGTTDQAVTLTINRIGGNAVALGFAPHPSSNIVRSEKTTATQYSTTIPLDNTKPQSNEGSKILEVNFTPLRADSYVRVVAVIEFSQDASAVSAIIAALFKDSGTDALIAKKAYPGVSNNWDGQLIIDYREPSGSTAQRTYKINVGSSTGNNFTISGRTGAGLFDGLNISSMTVSEE